MCQKNILITGGTGAIGFSIAHNICKKGYLPILISRDKKNLNKCSAELAENYSLDEVKSFSCDVSDYNSVKNLFDMLEKENIQFFALVNCAGISGGGITKDTSIELWNSVINTNLNGTFYVTREILSREMLEKNGRIVNIASTGGKQGVIHGAPYSASKHGVVGFTKSLGLELARNGSGITVNAVCPGFVESEMAERVRTNYSRIWNTDKHETFKRVVERIPIGRYIEPTEVAGMVEYLISDVASGVTAQALNVCGGLGNY